MEGIIIMSFPIKTCSNDMNKCFCLSVSILNKPQKYPQSQFQEATPHTHTHTHTHTLLFRTISPRPWRIFHLRAYPQQHDFKIKCLWVYSYFWKCVKYIYLSISPFKQWYAKIPAHFLLCWRNSCGQRWPRYISPSREEENRRQLWGQAPGTWALWEDRMWLTQKKLHPTGPANSSSVATWQLSMNELSRRWVQSTP